MTCVSGFFAVEEILSTRKTDNCQIKGKTQKERPKSMKFKFFLLKSGCFRLFYYLYGV